ncbi:MAG: class I mannose-6-phosphate isomerase [Sphingomonadales bacterium]|nr:class I mannose-6-phosphate isomerase [Sphingomonadales bacterium]
MVEKPWGKEVLPNPFVAPPGQRIGEVWFEPPPSLNQLLVKYIFASEKLSVQVHPSDAQTLAAGLGRQGKEECWLVIAAEPGATLGIGFDDPIDPDAMRAAAVDGSIEQRLVWHPVHVGDFFYIPANTVHAIGAGVSLIEVQQNSDITYRLYDYGRPRELHLDQGIAVSNGAPYADLHRYQVPARGEHLLVDGPLFRLVRYDGGLSAQHEAAFAGGPMLVVPAAGVATVAGEVVHPGQCALALDVRAVRLAAGATGLIAQPMG